MTTQDLGPLGAPRTTLAPDAEGFGERFLQRMQERDDIATRARYEQAAADDPAVAGEALDLGRQLGLPPETARLSLDVARKLVQERDTRYRQLVAKNPYYAAAMASRPAEAAVLAEDTDGLLQAQSLWDEVRYGWERGDTLTATGLMGATAMAGGMPLDQAKREYAETMGRTAMRVRSGFFAGSAELLGQQVRNLPGLVGGGFAGSAFGPGGAVAGVTGVLAAQSAMIEAGSAFLGMLAEGADESDARIAAVGVGLVNAALEVTGARVVTAPFRKLAARSALRSLPAGLTAATAGSAIGKVIKTYSLSLGAETGTEIGQEIVQMMGEALVRPEGAPAPSWGEVFGRITEIAGKTLQGMALLGVPGSVAELAHHKATVAASKQHQEFIGRVAETGDKSKVLSRSADVFEEHIAATAHGTAAENIHVGAAELDTVLKQSGHTRDQFASLLPDAAKALEAAAQAGTDIVIPIGTYEAKVARTPLGQALKPHIRLSTNSYSAAELASPEVQERLEALTEESKAAMESSKQVAAEAKEIEDKLYEQGVAAGRPAGEARQAAILHRNVIVALAARAGKTPSELAPVTVQAGTPAAGTVQQAPRVATDGDEINEVGMRDLLQPAGRTQSVGAESEAEALTEGIQRIRSASSSVRYLATRDGAPTSVLQVVSAPGRPATVANVFTVPEARRQGTARELFKAAAQDFPGLDFSPALTTSGAAFANAVSPPGPDGDLTVRAGPSKAPRGTFDPKKLLVILTKNSADPTTIFHELGHFYIDTLARLASEANAAPELVADMQILLDWFKVKDLQTWNALSLKDQAPHLEAFTYNWEEWLHTGKAPTLELQGVFSRIAAWFRKAYRAIRAELADLYRTEFGRDLPGLTPEVRGVFERMVASEDAINRTADARALYSIHGGLRGEMAQEQWDAYKAMHEKQRAAAIDELTRQGLKDMKWLAGARSRLLKQAQSTVADTREGIRKEVEATLRESPTYRVLEFLTAGTLKDDTGVDQRPRIALSDMESFEARWPDGKQKLRGIAGKEGNIGPDTLAEMFGFKTGVEMLDAIIAAPPLDVAVEQATDARMFAEHAELADPELRVLAVEAALHNEVRERVLAAELQALEKTTKPDRLVIAAAKEVAERLLAREKVGLISPARFADGEVRAAKKLREALKASDLSAAVFYARQQLIQNQLVRLSIAATREINDAHKLVAKLQESDKKLGKTRNVYYVQAARSILSSIGLYGGEKLPLQHLDQLREYNRELFDAISPVIDAAMAGNTLRQYDSVAHGLTMQQLRDVLRTVDGLWHLSRDAKQLQLENEAVNLDTVIAELSAPLLDMAPMGSAGKRTSELTMRDTIANTVNSVKGATRRVEFWAEAMDGGGGKVGPFTKFVWRPVRAALNAYRARRNDVVRRYVKLVDGLKLRGAAWERIPAPGLGTSFANKAELLGAMLHTGNVSNLQKLLRGYGWGDFKSNGELDTSRWDLFVAGMIKKKLLTKQDFDFLQATWDLAEELRPDLQRAHFKVFGFHFKEVVAKGFTNEFGAYRGGYVPAAADKAASAQGRMQDQMAALEGDFRQTIPSTPSGFTKERVEAAARPLALDLRRMVGHFDQVVRFTFVQPAVRNVLKVVGDREFADLLTSRDRTAIEKMLLPWLGRVARQTTQQAGLSPDFDRFWTAVRRRAGLALMAWNVSNTLQQLTGLILAATKVRPGYLGSALWTLMSSRRKATVDAITAASPFMADRLNSQMSELSQELHDLTEKPGAYKTMQAWGQRHGYYLQVKVQNQLDLVIWQGAYDQAMADGTVANSADAHTEAVARADAAVRTTQQSLAPEDLAAYETGTPFVKLFTHMSGYFNMMLNGNITQVGSILREAGWTGAPGRLTTAVLLGFLAPTVIADAIAKSMAGKWDDDDEDGEWHDDVAAWFFGSIGRGALALLPGGTNLAVPFNALNDKPYDDRILTAPATSALEAVLVGVPRAVGRASRGEGVSGRSIKDVLTLVSLLSGLPLTALGRPVSYGIDGPRDGESAGVADTVRGFVTGTR